MSQADVPENSLDIKHVRRDYTQGRLTRDSLQQDPMQQFANWFQAAKDHPSQTDPTAFTVATVSADGQPHQRVVLLKEVRTDGFVFYTNYNSAKGQDIAHNPKVAMHFAWLALEQQIRIEGHAEKISQAESESYFYQRPRESQLGALASSQSSPIASRSELEQHYHQLTEQYEGKTIPMPAHWGGYLIKPQRFEFWQGGRYRLHDRFVYQLGKHGWNVQRLQP
ncbi:MULTISPECIES: pyridoxamine 5'-phosphate oxidase [Idiomarinaceae]|uniref:Pyridoxine/pyridoxamine 5'-phosphate oxidase n=1 Tax=Pseudidiomarina fusca TaxID=2965078 RepID=A0ABU3KYL9_9GAMM|nr:MULTISPECIES: pyridoxamine 5'-phosphate oxidase [Idiomarinaceae]MDX1525441.1 pyridoxamine 5'-phosphate oxidase [Pseudidiomarina maritima]MDT7526190.1 pyridoxamine 5'-phosphate oxidase [Pseudidiomarina sp. GXY010]MRJ41517.1 pyridoxamine 5'-phosphate oxidase [Idiomarina sp. FeN1]NCU57507.1 pyridoxamine 5'-phosphate oxidase [Idiomarina sp. FenA--70]NCU60059.1 pyridoxamine 5'-phosphate oxidase [Idiomarina sp. FenBw--71]